DLYLSDTFNHRIRRMDCATGRITTVAGNGSGGVSREGGPGGLAPPHNAFWGVGGEDGGPRFAHPLHPPRRQGAPRPPGGPPGGREAPAGSGVVPAAGQPPQAWSSPAAPP